MKPIISVMVATYNQAEFIEKTLDSIINQTYNYVEIIVSDDSPNTLTEEIIRSKYLNRDFNGKIIKYVHNYPSKGEYGNYRYMLYELASGDWIINIDGDDFLYDKNFFKKAIDFIDKNNNIVLITSKKLKYDFFNKKFIKVDNIPYEDIITDGSWLFFNHIFKNVEIPHIGTIYNRKKAIEVGFYEYDIPSNDRESLLRLSLTGNIVYLNGYYGAWVVHGENHSQNITIEELLENIEMYDRLYNYASNFRLSKIKLSIWKVVAKYKMLYYYFNIGIFDRKEFLKSILRQNRLLALLLIIDPRNYKLSKKGK